MKKIESCVENNICEYFDVKPGINGVTVAESVCIGALSLSFLFLYLHTFFV